MRRHADIMNLQSASYVPRIKDRGADLFVALLRAQGVKQVMALTGGAIMEGMDALQEAEHLEMSIFQTEPGAAWAAMGYARATGKVGVCVVTSGPAATNTITAIADAYRDNVPLVVVTGQVPTFARNTDAFQETDITGIAAPTVKKVYYVSCPEEMPDVVREAFHLARDGRPGPVLIDLTKDAQQSLVDLDAYHADLEPINSVISDKRSDETLNAELDEVIAHLNTAERPVIIAGYGLVLANAEHELEKFLEVVPSPAVYTIPGKPTIATSHPCNYGLLGMHGFYVANWIVHHADLVVSLGSRYDDRITGDTARFAPQAKRLIHFDIDPEQIRKVLPERKLGIVGDLKETLGALRRRLTGTLDYPDWHQAIAEVEKEYPSTYARRPELLQAQHVMHQLNEAVEQRVAADPCRVIYTTGCGPGNIWPWNRAGNS